MFKINLRRLLRVLFILGLLLPTYVLPSSSTSTPVFAEGGLEDTEALEGEARGAQCKAEKKQPICIRRIQKPDFGEEVGKRLVVRGRFPEGTLLVAVRNPDGEVVYKEPIEYEGGNRVKVNLGDDFKWQEGSHTVTIMAQGARVGDSISLDVVESNGRLIRKKESGFDAQKVKKPLIGEIITGPIIQLSGRFDSAPVEITLRFPNGEVVKGKAVKHEDNKLVVRFQEIPHGIGTYHLTITSRSGKTDTISFGVGGSDSSPSIRGCGRAW